LLNDAITFVSAVFHDAILTAEDVHKAYIPWT